MLFFFFNDTATTEIYTLSLHDALPISVGGRSRLRRQDRGHGLRGVPRAGVVRLLLHCHPGPRFHSPHAARGAATGGSHTASAPPARAGGVGPRGPHGGGRDRRPARAAARGG